VKRARWVDLAAAAAAVPDGALVAPGFELGAGGATLAARHPWAAAASIAERTGFPFRNAQPLPVTGVPSPECLRAIRRLDPAGLRDRLVG
jgi:hypothetical protein